MAITRRPAAEQGGATAALNNEAQEGRERARQTAREYLDSTSFLQCERHSLVSVAAQRVRGFEYMIRAYIRHHFTTYMH